jgi:hypothetical protein
MRNTFSWSCPSCGEYNVVDLTAKAGPQVRCEFCFRPVQRTPGIVDGPAAEPPSPPPSDDWLGNVAIPPFFSAAPRSDAPPSKQRPSPNPGSADDRRRKPR